MSHLVLPILAALLMPQAPQQPPSPQTPRSLADMRDHYRPLLIFAPPYELATKLSEQVDSLQTHRAELLDRQVLLVPFFSAGLAKLLDPDTVDVYLVGQEASLRHRFHIHPSDFTVILLGKDGSEKFRSHTPITIDKLIHLIDAMPMRQQEIRSRHGPSTHGQ